MLEQISIWEYLAEKKESDFPCDTCVFDCAGCCSYDEPLGKYCENGSAYIKRYKVAKDERLNDWKKVEPGKSFIKGVSTLDTDSDCWSVQVNIDCVFKGQYDGRPAEIGCRLCLYGLLEYNVFVPIMWREVEA